MESSVSVRVAMSRTCEGKRQPRRNRTRCSNIKMDLKQTMSVWTGFKWFMIGSTSCEDGSDF
jgi:hypothetical protein